MCGDCEWEEFLEEIDETIEDDRFDFALDFLESVREWVATNEHCTEPQREGVANVRRSRGA